MTVYRAARATEDTPDRVGVLVTNLGTPDAPTPSALRRYLREFLSDPRVIEYPRWLWWIILNVFVLTTRPRKSAKLYASIWTPEGSPLLTITRAQSLALRARLEAELGDGVRVEMGMRYGSPSIASGLRALADAGCTRVVVLPLYPQYFAGTTGSTFDAVADELATWRHVPEVHVMSDYHDDAGYVRATAASIREAWKREGAPDRLVFSFHGIPERYSAAGDPYIAQCHESARLIVDELGLTPDQFIVTFQSRFGREEWVKPYTDDTLRGLPGDGAKRVMVVCPGFSADCLETLEEISGLNRGFFMDAGGEAFHYVPALNTRDNHVDALRDIVMTRIAGWTRDAGATRE